MLKHCKFPKSYDQSCRQNLYSQSNFHKVLSFKLSLQVCAAEFESYEYYSVSTYTTAVHSFQSSICTAVFVLFTATCFFVCVYRRYDTINSHLTQIFMCATVNVETVLLDFSYLCTSNYQFTKFCYIFLCTYVYKISKFAHNTYTKIFSDCKSKNVCAYKFIHGSYH